MVVVALIAAAVLGAVALSGFLRLEATGRRHVTLAILVGVLMLEAMLNRAEYNVPEGLFRVDVGGFAVRPPDIVLGLALMARFLAGGAFHRVTATGLAWASFLLWYAGAAAAGVLYGNDTREVFYQGRAIYYIGGVAILAAGTSFAPFVKPKVFARWAAVFGAAATFTIVAGVLGLHWRFFAGPLKLPDLGRINNDAISLLIAGGGIILLVEATRAQRRPWLAVAGALCVLSPFSGTQRANYLALAATLGVIALAALGPTWRRRVKATPSEALLILGGLAAMSIAVLTYSGPSVDVVGQVESTFFAGEQAASADARVSLWREGMNRISERPVFGWGLGILDQVRIKGYMTESELTQHNIFLDVGTRAGLVGVLLAGVALLLTLVDAARAWRLHPDDQLAALALGMAAVVLAFVGKGMVESTFEKYRLNVALGLAVGCIMALVAAVDRRGEPAAAEPGPGQLPSETRPV